MNKFKLYKGKKGYGELFLLSSAPSSGTMIFSDSDGNPIGQHESGGWYMDAFYEIKESITLKPSGNIIFRKNREGDILLENLKTGSKTIIGRERHGSYVLDNDQGRPQHRHSPIKHNVAVMSNYYIKQMDANGRTRNIRKRFTDVWSEPLKEITFKMKSKPEPSPKSKFDKIWNHAVQVWE